MGAGLAHPTRMKKQPKKLQLSRETVRQLNEQHLANVEGGLSLRNFSISCDPAPRPSFSDCRCDRV
jgi:hypothetical protein